MMLLWQLFHNYNSCLIHSLVQFKIFLLYRVHSHSNSTMHTLWTPKRHLITCLWRASYEVSFMSSEDVHFGVPIISILRNISYVIMSLYCILIAHTDALWCVQFGRSMCWPHGWPSWQATSHIISPQAMGRGTDWYYQAAIYMTHMAGVYVNYFLVIWLFGFLTWGDFL